MNMKADTIKGTTLTIGLQALLLLLTHYMPDSGIGSMMIMVTMVSMTITTSMDLDMYSLLICHMKKILKRSCQIQST